MNISDVLLCKLDDNKHEGHTNTVWKLNGRTMMQIRSDEGASCFVPNSVKGPARIMGLRYEIDHSMNDGEIELQN